MNSHNWFMTPLLGSAALAVGIAGEFNIIIRNYWPKEEALNGAYVNPPIKRVP